MSLCVRQKKNGSFIKQFVALIETLQFWLQLIGNVFDKASLVLH